MSPVFGPLVDPSVITDVIVVRKILAYLGLDRDNALEPIADSKRRSQLELFAVLDPVPARKTQRGSVASAKA